MFIVNNSILKKVPKYIVDERLGKILSSQYGLPILSIQNKKYFFSVTEKSEKAMGEIPSYYRWLYNIIKTEGGEEN